MLFAWQPSGNYVASIGEGSRNLFLFDRRGVQVEEVTLKSTAKVTQLEWDKDGEILAILQQKEDWTVNARSVVSCLARNMREQMGANQPVSGIRSGETKYHASSLDMLQ